MNGACDFSVTLIALSLQFLEGLLQITSDREAPPVCSCASAGTFRAPAHTPHSWLLTATQGLPGLTRGIGNVTFFGEGSW